MKLLNEIKKQPPHIREIFMWLCVVIVFSVFVFAGFRETQDRITALLHPDEASEEGALAANMGAPSPFAFIGGYLDEIGASIIDIINIGSSGRIIETEPNIEQENNVPELSPGLLPTSSHK